jgi:hypothetical protein
MDKPVIFSGFADPARRLPMIVPAGDTVRQIATGMAIAL